MSKISVLESGLQKGRAVAELPIRTESFGRRYRRDRPWAVKDLSLEIAAGSIVALVGPNGSGKSTLMRACLGFESADAGEIRVFGADPSKQRALALSQVGYVPQATALYGSLRIRDHLTMAKAARPSFDEEFAMDRIESAELSQSRKVGTLSGGEQAQVALALALGTRAPLLLLDEPLASLDPLARRDFLAAVSLDVRQRGATAIISSHLIADIDQVCDLIIILVDGQLALATSTAAAQNIYRVVGPEQPLKGQAIIGEFNAQRGEPMILVRGDAGGHPATLEEIVLGHLAQARAKRKARV